MGYTPVRQKLSILCVLIAMNATARTSYSLIRKDNILNARVLTSAAVPDTAINESEIALDSPVLISSQFTFTEGPAADAAGNIYFTDQPNNKIWKYDINGRLTLFMDSAGRSNGMYFDKKGNLITCADEHNELWSINPRKRITILVRNFGCQALNGPNDLWVNPLNGGIYFTDPYYKRDYWDKVHPHMEAQNVYYLPKNKKQPIIAESVLEKPNGIIGTPDSRTLYVADIKGNKTYAYRINDDGSLGGKRLFVSKGSDGMTIDERGNIYLTGKGVTVYNASGKEIQHFEIPEAWTANVCFGGSNNSLLFITASKSIYVVHMKVRGTRI